MNKKVYISYKEFGEKLIELYQMILNSEFKPTCIMGIRNGGINISKPLYNWFNSASMVYNEITIRFYEGEITKISPMEVNIPPYDWEDSLNKILLVDDIVDEGNTINYFMEHTKLKQGDNLKVASIHWFPGGKYRIKPDFFIDKKKKNTWIVYPWEYEYIEMINKIMGRN